MVRPGAEAMAERAAKPRMALIQPDTMLRLALLVALGLIWWVPFRGQVHARYDLREQVLPGRIFYSLALERGELGMWNPFLRCGYNHLGEGQGGILHPLHLIVYKLLPVVPAIVLELYALYPVALLGMLLFLRRSLKLGPVPALFGGGLFACSSFTIAHLAHVNMTWIYAHLPWALLAADGVLRGRRPLAAAGGLALVYGSMGLLGHPQMAWLVGSGTGLYALVAVAASAAARRWRRWLLLIAGMVLGLGIGFVQLKATWDYLQESPRATLSAAERQNYSLHPKNLLVNLAPWLFAERVVGDIIMEDGFEEFVHSHEEFAAYGGLGVLCLVLIGGWMVRDQWRAGPASWAAGVLVIGLAMCLLMALGKHGSINEAYGLLPGLRSFRAPARYMSLAVALLAVAAAWVLDRLERTPPERLAVNRKVAGGVLAAAVTVAGLALAGMWDGTRDWRFLAIGPLLAAAMVAGLWALAAYPRAAKWLVPGLAAVCLLDVALWSAPLLVDPARRDFSDLTRARHLMATQDHTYRRWANSNLPWWEGYYLASGYLGIEPDDETRRIEIGLNDLGFVMKLHGESDPRTQDLLAYTARLLNIVGVNRVYGNRLLDDRLTLYSRLPRVLSPLDPGNPWTSSESMVKAPADAVAVIEDGFDRQVFEIDYPNVGYFEFGDSQQRGWEIRLDQGPWKSRWIGYGRRVWAIAVPPGTKRVELRFRPPGFERDLGISLECLLLALCLIVAGASGGQRRSEPPVGETVTLA